MSDKKTFTVIPSNIVVVGKLPTVTEQAKYQATQNTTYPPTPTNKIIGDEASSVMAGGEKWKMGSESIFDNPLIHAEYRQVIH